MKIKDDARFPHPVLASHIDDFCGAELRFAPEVREVPSTGEVTISGRFEVDVATLKAGVEDGRLGCALFVTCENTYFSSFESIPLGMWEVSIAPGLLRGVVRLRAVIYVAAESFHLPKEGVHTEFDVRDFLLNRHDLVGFSEEYRFDAGLEKLVRMESVFRLQSSDDIENGLFLVGTDTQAIVIKVHPKLYKGLNAARDTEGGKQLLLSALYLPCLVEILDVASKEKAEHLRWYRAIESRCQHLDIELDGNDLLRKAQILLGLPASRITAAMEALSE